VGPLLYRDSWNRPIPFSVESSPRSTEKLFCQRQFPDFPDRGNTHGIALIELYFLQGHGFRLDPCKGQIRMFAIKISRTSSDKFP
jgi:hypothetical protein